MTIQSSKPQGVGRWLLAHLLGPVQVRVEPQGWPPSVGPTHRRKVRAWQMICILSRFGDQEIVSQVMDCLHTALYRNHMPAVRQYLETFAIYVYLKFPSLVGEQLVLMALSSYVFIAANVILHATKSRHLEELLPPIIPLLTSHHHSLRGFTQLLVYQVLSKLMPTLDGTVSLEKRCFLELKSYLEDNSDCARYVEGINGSSS
ncbi:hypothetical protein L2E82_15087 [Cichorium intybus]|uniref:Uncharacterized protein n=1 Tax=Cichorium intybus TaxID=13427 RepID=A0ACB9F2Q4_CICIN|nr:hypothetical protein L2E82_15087 [Cichorium intybus]